MLVSTPVPDDETRFTLSARDGDRVQARLPGRWLTPRLILAGRPTFEEGIDVPHAWRAFAEAVRERHTGSGGEVLVLQQDETRSWCEALAAAGFDLARRKAFVERSLKEDLPPSPEDLSFATLAEVGEEAFLERMARASEGDPFEEGSASDRDLEREWRELLEYAGERFEADDWFLVDDAAGPLGVLLPQAISEEEGTLFYVGVLPSRRGEGRGRDLHAAGLRMLSARGLVKYVGSTDLRNEAMRRVFARNGCPVTRTQLFFALPASSAGSGEAGSGP